MKAAVHKTSASGASSKASLHLDPSGATLDLQAAQFIQLHGALGWTVKALDGAIWITQDGDPRDIVLTAGESLVLDRKSAALLSSFGKARACVSMTGCRQDTPRAATASAPSRPAPAHPAFA